MAPQILVPLDDEEEMDGDGGTTEMCFVLLLCFVLFLMDSSKIFFGGTLREERDDGEMSRIGVHDAQFPKDQ